MGIEIGYGRLVSPPCTHCKARDICNIKEEFGHCIENVGDAIGELRVDPSVSDKFRINVTCVIREHLDD